MTAVKQTQQRTSTDKHEHDFISNATTYVYRQPRFISLASGHGTDTLFGYILAYLLTPNAFNIEASLFKCVNTTGK